MKNAIRLVGMAAILAVLVAGAGDAQANCGISKLFGQFEASAGLYVYTYGIGNTGVIGRFWQTGNRSLANEGTYSAAEWFQPYGTKMIINGDLGAAGSVGCVANSMSVVIQSNDGMFATGVAPEVLAGSSLFYSYARNGNWNAIPIPRPGVTVAGSAGTVRTLNLTFGSTAAANYGGTVVTGFRLMQAFGTADPGRGVAAYTFNQRVASTGGAGAAINGLALDCSTVPAGQDVFYATQLEFDNGQFNGDYVSATTRVKCNSTQADPKFRRIDKKNL